MDVRAAAGALALASIYVIEDPAIALAARGELNDTTGGTYICPIPADIHPNTQQ